MLPHLYLQPIYVIVFDVPQEKPHLVASFALRCFQRISLPDVATQPCTCHDNWYPSGRSTPLLPSYGQVHSRYLRSTTLASQLARNVPQHTHAPLSWTRT